MWSFLKRRLRGPTTPANPIPLLNAAKTKPTPVRVVPPAVIEAAERKAAELGVDSRLHPADYIFWATLNSVPEAEPEAVAAAYFDGGRGTASFIADQLRPRTQGKTVRLLDFAGGYARVARHFTHTMPEAQVTLSDIHDEAVAFARDLQLAATESSWDPDSFNPGVFDAVVAISFLTHMPRETWTRWLAAMGRALAPGGTLLFTTHGAAALPIMGVKEVPADGFIYFHHSEQADLDMANYASTATLAPFVRSAAKEAGLEIISFAEAGLGYQDVWLATPATPSGDTPSGQIASLDGTKAER